MIRLAASTCLILLLAACAGPEPGDGPGRPLDPSSIDVPQPRAEPRARYGNHSPYTVLGRTYHVRDSAAGYSERGLASWYGSKFHGRLTSSGEPFDMYKVSAAHRSLPLPTWVEVTNLDNGRTLVVRVNDRGPFKDGRIIDLSYAAAIKLDVVEAGTARVEVRALDVGRPPADRIDAPVALPVELQAGAFSHRDSAELLATRLRANGIDRVRVERSRRGADALWRVRIGPIRDGERARSLIERMVGLGLDRPVYVYP